MYCEIIYNYIFLGMKFCVFLKKIHFCWYLILWILKINNTSININMQFTVILVLYYIFSLTTLCGSAKPPKSTKISIPQNKMILQYCTNVLDGYVTHTNSCVYRRYWQLLLWSRPSNEAT